MKYYASLIEYKIGVYAVKFYLKRDKSNPDKYKVMVNNGNAIKVLKTIVAIMLDVLNKDNKASFAFIGMPGQQENINETKRYKVYKKISQRYFSYDNFEHFRDPRRSFYMIVNKKSNVNDLRDQILRIAESEMREDTGNSINFGRSTY